MQETEGMRIQSLGQEDPLEESIATHSSILAWRIPRTEEPGGLRSIESQRVRQDWSDLACVATEQPEQLTCCEIQFSKIQLQTFSHH